MNVRIPKTQFVKLGQRWPVITFDYYGYTFSLDSNDPVKLPDDAAQASGKKAIVFAYQPGRTYGKLIDFGQYGAEDFLTGASKEKRRAYLSRAMNIKDGKGHLTALDKYSPNHWSIKFLWGYTPRLNSKHIVK